jgi:Apea-like HEPN
MNNDFNHETSTIFLREKVDAGKYHFELVPPGFNMDRFQEDLQKALAEKKDITPPKLGIRVSRRVEGETTEQVEKEAAVELRTILDLLTLETDLVFGHGGHVYYEEEGPVRVNISLVSRKRFEEVSSDALRNAIAKLDKIRSFDSEKSQLLSRALEWYSEGTREPNAVKSYALLWIGFESLSLWNGGGVRRRCQHCSKELEDWSIIKRLKAFAASLGVSDGESVEALYEKRNMLFHRANSVSREDRNQLKELLRSSIIACIDQTIANRVP